MTISLLSPAKINLFLRIISKRSDGYHDIASLFQAIDLYDTLHISLANSDKLVCDHPEIPTDNSNLILKAAALFRAKTGINTGIQVTLEKKIPIQAGLGGGSSNAATTLWALNHLTKSSIPISQLMAWSVEIGSDIPFFLSQGTAYCTGKGENVKTLPPLEKQSLWVVKPSQGLSTPEIFRRYNYAAAEQRDSSLCLQNFLKGKPTYFNDLETPAFEVLPSLRDIKVALLKQGFETVLMTGSGSSLFCFGGKEPPRYPGAMNYKVSFTNRFENSWYRSKA